MTRVCILVLAGALAACGTAGTAGTGTPTPTVGPPTSAPNPSPVVSAKGGITLKTPSANAKVTSPVTISGDASVFEAALQWRITDASGRVIVEGNTTASLGAPGRGTYSVTATYTVSAEMPAFIEVYSRSAKDGTIDESVRIPVTLR